MAVPQLFRDLNAAAVWAGLTAFIWYAFGPVPLQIAVSGQLGLSNAQSSSWIFIVWFSGALSSIALSLYYRQPIPITWTIPGLVYLGTLAGQFTFPELVGANLLAGVMIVALGLLGIGERIMTWLPLPIVMGMFAGSIVGYVTRLVKATVDDLLVAGLTVVGYMLGRSIANPRVPPVGLAVVCGGVAVFFSTKGPAASLSWTLPALVIPDLSFSFPAFVAVSLPMLVLAMGLGNVQGLGFLLAQGYRAPTTVVTVVVGINSIINALLGGHPAITARTGVAIVAAPDAGPLSGRYWANIIAATLTILIALFAAPLSSMLAVLPSGYVLALAGLAILSSFQDALEKAFSNKLKFGALVAFAVTATPFSFAGITSAFWGVLVGLAASFLGERQELLAYWRPKI
ncbi:MAG: benzoate/H(+) symporter BenE family transporter [Deltaproteobacteria bacterium]|nr:benzoate/H(+) symporter BenE family transporter [Deltaproteobacteria bacterium]